MIQRGQSYSRSWRVKIHEIVENRWLNGCLPGIYDIEYFRFYNILFSAYNTDYLRLYIKHILVFICLLDLIHFKWTPIYELLISFLNDDWFLTPLKDKDWVYQDTSTRIRSFLLGKRHKNWSLVIIQISFIHNVYRIPLELGLPAAWPNGYGVRLRIGRLWVRVPSWSHVFEKWPIFDPWPWTYLSDTQNS